MNRILIMGIGYVERWSRQRTENRELGFRRWILTTCEVDRDGGWRVEGGEWKVEGGGWRVEGGGWRMEGGGWRVEGGGWRKMDGGWMEGMEDGTRQETLITWSVPASCLTAPASSCVLFPLV